MGRRTNLRLAQSKPPPSQGFRGFDRQRQNLGLHRLRAAAHQEISLPITLLTRLRFGHLDFTVGFNLQGSGPDPDMILDLFYGCGSSLNWDGYCNPEVDKLIEQQSIEADQGRRKQLLWGIERKLAEVGARPIIFYSRQGTCRQPYVKGLTIMVNSVFNGWRMEDVWLDQ